MANTHARVAWGALELAVATGPELGFCQRYIQLAKFLWPIQQIKVNQVYDTLTFGRQDTSAIPETNLQTSKPRFISLLRPEETLFNQSKWEPSDFFLKTAQNWLFITLPTPRDVTPMLFLWGNYEKPEFHIIITPNVWYWNKKGAWLGW